jgi:hypothetical protein
VATHPSSHTGRFLAPLLDVKPAPAAKAPAKSRAKVKAKTAS